MDKNSDLSALAKNFISIRYLWFAALFLALWTFFAPGPKHEEMFLIFFMVAMFIFGTTIFILFSNSITLIPSMSLIVFLIGWTLSTLKFSMTYEYDFWEIFVVDGMFLKIITFCMIYFFCLSLISQKVKEVMHRKS
jgi:hypothetical protein